MKIEPLTMADAFVCSPDLHRDDRGSFVEWFRGDSLRDVIGRGFVPLQANQSVSGRGVVRGLHFTDVPPGQAKYVYCPSGAVLDVVVDVRVGSPTFGVVDTVLLDDVDGRAVFIAEGLAHGFCALRDDSTVVYLVSTTYAPGIDRAVSPVDPAIAVPWPDDLGQLRMSDKDRAAPSLADAVEQGILPMYDACRAFYAAAV